MRLRPSRGPADAVRPSLDRASTGTPGTSSTEASARPLLLAVGVTAPRQILPGSCYLVTRRCSERRFFLKPSELTNAIVLYVLAVAAERFGVVVHAFCVLSNHLHLVITDPHGRLPAFEQYLDSLVARAINASLGRREAFWDPSGYNAVTPLTTQDVLDAAAYTLANPVAAGLVSCAVDWPGLWSRPEWIGGAPLTAERPRVFFREDGDLPPVARLQLAAPAGFASAAEFRVLLQAATFAREEKARQGGRRFLGRRRVLATSPTSSPPRREERRTLRPRFATRYPALAAAAICRFRSFLQAYREALAQLRSGVSDVVFPAGTYWWPLALGVRCAATGPP